MPELLQGAALAEHLRKQAANEDQIRTMTDALSHPIDLGSPRLEKLSTGEKASIATANKNLRAAIAEMTALFPGLGIPSRDYLAWVETEMNPSKAAAGPQSRRAALARAFDESERSLSKLAGLIRGRDASARVGLFNLAGLRKNVEKE